MATIKGTRSPIFWKNFPGGIPSIVDTSKFSGNIFFVDSNASGASDTAGHGLEPDGPFATIDFAITQCTASQGDVILVLPGHAETINAAGAIDLDKAGITVLGLGFGNKRPTITVGSSEDASTVIMSAADCKLANVILVPGNDGVGILLDINADGAVVEDCEFRSDETNAYQADTYVDINGGANGADRCVIRRCKFSSITAGANQAIEIGAVEDGLVIEDNWIVGDFAVAGIHSGAIFTNARIVRNHIHNVNAGDWCIEFTDAATGLLEDNRFYANAAATTLDPGSMMCVENYMVNAIDQSSVLVPTTAGGLLPTGAIGAATFAAGAIDAAAIANGAIDAATFAAGAIDAAAIANGAIDAATYAADALTLAGSTFVVTKALASTAVITTGVDVTAVSTTGLILIEDIIVQTDGTGLATGTNLEIKCDNTRGALTVFAEAVASLGANVTEHLASGSVTPGVPFVLEVGKKITANSTAMNCDGAGNITIYIICRRLANGAGLTAAA